MLIINKKSSTHHRAFKVSQDDYIVNNWINYNWKWDIVSVIFCVLKN